MNFKPSHLHLNRLHLPTLGDNHIVRRLTLTPHPRILNLLHDIHPVNHLAKHDVFVVEIRSRYRSDEELAAVGVGAGILSEFKTLANTTLCFCGRWTGRFRPTAMLKSPGTSCLTSKFSSAKALVP